MFNSNNSSSNSSLTTYEPDEIGKQLENLAKVTENYNESYKKLCKTRMEYEQAKQNIVHTEKACLRAKSEYDHVMAKYFDKQSQGTQSHISDIYN
jgi:dsDNA-specific endonuclease/ATPase MutS2